MAFKSKRIIVKDDESWGQLNEFISSLPELKNGKAYDFYISSESARSLEINALYHCYIKEIAKHQGETITDCMTALKLDYGYYFLKEYGSTGKSSRHVKAATEAYVWQYLSDAKGISFFNWSRAMQLRFVKNREVTRLLDNKHMAQYLKKIQVVFAEQGLELKSINEG